MSEQAKLTDEGLFETTGDEKGARKGQGDADVYPSPSYDAEPSADPTPATWPVNGVATSDADAEEVREALLDADPGTPVTVRGETVVVAEVRNPAIGQALGAAPTVHVAGREDRLVVGGDQEGVAWESDAEDISEGDDYDPESDKRVVGWEQVVVGGTVDLVGLAESGDLPVSDRSTCPECGDEGTPGFCADNVDAKGGIRPRAKDIPETVAELRNCGGTDGCGTAWVVLRDAETLPSEGQIPDARRGTNVGGLYIRTDTTRFWAMKERDEYRGIYTGAELADRLQSFAEGDGWTVNVYDGGDRVVRRDREHKAELEFHRIDPETVAERGETGEESDEAGLPESDAALPFEAEAEATTTAASTAGD
ncbi:MAG: hypothetical protein ACI9CA_000015 [Natronomonas sp.]|jgi:hypothetical protein